MTQPGAQIRQGYLLLADISGYTEFLTQTEIDHSHEIIRDLTKLIRASLIPPMQFVKLEGDAVFCFADAALLSNGERVLELVEHCYFAFGDRLIDMTRSTTCKCDACEAIGTLDLKFVTHYGSFVVDVDEDGRVDVSGPDVILAHRLLKNTIIESGGPDAYAFFSDASLETFPADLALPEHRESYEAFGETKGGVRDLGRAAEEMRDARRVRVTEDEADAFFVSELPVAPSVVWQYFVDPAKRARWMVLETGVVFDANQRGRLGAGASSHCAHGDLGVALREYLDWRPYEYFTCRFTPLPGASLMPPALESFEFAPLDGGGTRHVWLIRLEDRSEEALSLFATLREAIGEMARTMAANFRAVMVEDGATFGTEQPR